MCHNRAKPPPALPSRILAFACGCLFFSILSISNFICGSQEVYAEEEPLPEGAVLSLPPSGSKVKCVTFSPDGQRIAVGGGDMKVYLYDAVSGKYQGHLEGHTQPIQDIVFSPDGKWLATASQDHSAILWDLDLKSVKTRLEGHEESVNAVVFSPEGSKVMTASSDASLKLWAAPSGKLIRTLEGHEAGIEGLDFSRDGRTILSEAGDVTARIWDAITGCELLVLPERDGTVASLCISPDGRMGMTTSEGHLWHVFDMSTGQDIQILKGHRANGSASKFFPMNRYVLTGAMDGTVRQWDLATGQQIRSWGGYEGMIESVDIDPLETRILAASTQRILVWDLSVPPPNPSSALPEAVTQERLSTAWTELGSDDPDIRTAAAWVLLEGKDAAVTFLGNKLLQPEHTDEMALKKLIDDLNSDRYAVRQGAAEALRDLDRGSRKMLRELHAEQPTDARLQLAEILHDRLRPTMVRQTLALEVLGWAQTACSKALLEDLASRGRASPYSEHAASLLKRNTAAQKASSAQGHK